MFQQVFPDWASVTPPEGVPLRLYLLRRMLAENEALRGELGTLKATLLKGHGGYVGCEAANDELERLCRERDETREILRRLFKLGQPPGDWACAECRPGSEVLRVGFKCAYHAAAEVLT
jgi:hypothetical protein